MHSTTAIVTQTRKSLKLAKKAFLVAAFFIVYQTGFGQKSSSDKKQKPVTGTCSFYANSLEGEKTATGETFHHSGMTAASNFFKLNTWIRVTNLQTGKSIMVRINDRMSKGMAAIGRVADLTRTAAKELGILAHGLGKVKVEEVPAF